MRGPRPWRHRGPSSPLRAGWTPSSRNRFVSILGRPHDRRCGELGIGTETFRNPGVGIRHSAQGLRAEACSDCFSQLAMASRTRSRVLIAPSANTVRWAVTRGISHQARPRRSGRTGRAVIRPPPNCRQADPHARWARCPAFSPQAGPHSPWLRHRPLPHAAHFGTGWADGLSRTALMPDSLLRMI
jgi:hypothetical protein